MERHVLSSPRGAYGLTLPSLPGQEWLTPAPEEWPVWHLTYAQHEELPLADMQLGDDSARIPLLDQGVLQIDRLLQTAVVSAPRPPVDSAWVHPCLSPVAIVAADWAGRLAFHAGCFLDARHRVWGVFGHRGLGKSTCMAWMAVHDRVVFGDDLLITDGIEAFAGPRLVDLREPAAAHLGVGRPLGEIGLRERWRVGLGDVQPAVAPLAGFVDLRWSDDESIMVRPVDASEKANRLSRAKGLMVRQQHHLAWLYSLSRPLLEFRRPRRWGELDIAMTQLLAHVDDTP